MRPPHFPLIPLKHLCREPVAYGSNESSDSYVSEGVRFLRTTDITDNGLLIPSEKGVYLPPELAASSRLLDGDLLLSRSGTIGRAFLYRRALHGDCAHAGYLVRFRPKPTTDPRWLFYFSKSTLFRDQIAEDVVQSTIANFNGQKFASLRVPSPPLSLQRRIADFLDIKTAAIDELIAKKERLAALLQEKRQTVITQAVTKGLDPNVKMKESGVEWIGRVPEHWKVLPLKRLARRGARTFTDGDWIEAPYITDSGIRLLQTGNIGTGVFKEQGFRYISELTFVHLKCTEVFPGDVLICRLDGPVGRACVAPSLSARMITSVDNAILKPSPSVDPRFVVYVLSTPEYLDWVQGISRVGGGFRYRISRSILGDIRVPAPPLREQSAIADTLDVATRGLRELEARIGDSITKLREYRQSLITAAVTGKLDVTADERAVDDRLTALEASG